MKYKLLVALLAVQFQSVIAQDWAPFIQDRHIYFSYEDEGELTLEHFVMDTVIDRSTHQVQLFNTGYTPEPCHEQTSPFLPPPNYYHPVFFDSVEVRGSEYTIFEDGDSLLLLVDAVEGDEWMSGDNRLTYESSGTRTILGTVDTVKTIMVSYGPFDWTHVVLSKNHGLLEFWPLDQYSAQWKYRTSFELIGWKSETASAGYQLPGIADYFDRNVGDKLFWHSEGAPEDNGPELSPYTLDSITTIYWSGDSVRFEYDHYSYWPDGELFQVEAREEVVLKSEQGHLFQAPTSAYVIYNDELRATSIQLETTPSGYITDLTSNWYGLLIDSAICHIDEQLTDHSLDHYRSDGTAQQNGHWTGFYNYEHTMIGAILSDDTTGTVEFPFEIVPLKDFPKVKAFDENWGLFPIGEESVFEHESANGRYYHLSNPDQLEARSADDLIRFDHVIELQPECTDEISAADRDPYGFYQTSRLDSCLVTDSTFEFVERHIADNLTIDTLVFKPNVQVGESWTSVGLTFTCTQAYPSLVDGVGDSIKEFKIAEAPYDTVTFVLSKTRGLLQFIPFRSLINKQKDGYMTFIAPNIAFDQPRFETVFTYQPGDLRYWNHDRMPSFSGDIGEVEIYVDSITDVYYGSDSIHYTFLRTTYEYMYATVEQSEGSEYFLRDKEGRIIEGPTNASILAKGVYNEYEFASISGIWINDNFGDQVLSRMQNFTGRMLDDEHCEVVQLSDLDNTIGYAQILGRIEISSYAWTSDIQRLKGAVIDGKVWGDTTIPVVDFVPEIEMIAVSAYPNPFQNHIQLATTLEGVHNVELYDVTGALVHRSSNSMRIDTEDLPAGSYVLRLQDSRGKATTRRLFKVE